MYCTACGKQIIDTARFCNYCGTPVAGAVFAEPAAPAAPSAPVSMGAPVGAPPVSEPVQGNISLESSKENAANEAVSSSEPAQAPIAEPQFSDSESPLERTQAAEYGEVSEPVSDNAYGSVSDIGQPVPNEQAPVPDTVSNTVSNIEIGNAYQLPAPGQIPVSGEGGIHAAVVSEKPAKPLPERKYTLGHIMMCLAAVAIMAIVAGVFAGLYFSVV